MPNEFHRCQYAGCEAVTLWDFCARHLASVPWEFRPWLAGPVSELDVIEFEATEKDDPHA